MKGKLIVLEGTDGSGKGTHTKLLAAKLQALGHNVRTLSFPTYGKPSCKPVELYLNGEFGEDVDPYFTSMLYAYNRKMEMPAAEKNLENGTHYILNRYVSANAGHQAGKIADTAARKKFLAWLSDLEYGQYGLPKPDMTILLHMPPAVGQQLVAKKEEDRSYLEGREKDVHEADIAHLESAEQAFLEVAEEESWEIVECGRPGLTEEETKDGTIAPEQKVRTIKEVNQDLLRKVEALLKDR